VNASEAAFEQLFRDHYESVLRYVTRRVPADEVQDVVAQTFLAAWRRQQELRGDPLPWLLGVARRTSANQLRSEARRVALVDRLGGELRVPLPADVGGRSRLAEALRKLSEGDREALLLVAWDGLDHRAAARVSGCTTATFAVRLHRARRRLERALAGEEKHPINVNEQARSNP
jgi:RNA polymerase sigma-70 factor (ECF subfamily)